MANIKQVAAKAQLSVSCISKYLKDPNSVLPTTRDKIEAAISELHYVPSALARNLRTKRTGIIKILSHSITNPYFAEMFERLRKNLEEIGYIAVLQIIESMEAFTFHQGVYDQADGIILCFLENDLIFDSLSQTIPACYPVVCMHGHKPVQNIATIILDVRQGSRLATDYLISQGCKRMAYVGGPEQSAISMLKFQGFQEALSAAGDQISCTGVVRGTYELQSGYRGAKELLTASPLPDAILCENDVLAAGVIHRLTECSILVPEQMRVIGYDDIPLAAMFLPTLTSVSFPASELCAAACEELFAQLNKQKTKDHRFTPQLVIRQS